MAIYKKGDIIRFTYPSNNDRFKEVLVLNELWEGKMHGLDLKNATVAEREVLRVVLDPRMKGKRHRLPLVNDILTRMDPPELIKQPYPFYNRFVKPFIQNKDMYRTYIPMKMTGIQQVTQKYSSQRGFGSSLFGAKPTTTQPTQQAGVGDVIARALKLGGSVAKDVTGK